MDIACSVVEYHTNVSTGAITIVLETLPIPNAVPSTARFSIVLQGADILSVLAGTIATIQAAGPPADDVAAATLFKSAWDAALNTTLVGLNVVDLT